MSIKLVRSACTPCRLLFSFFAIGYAVLAASPVYANWGSIQLTDKQRPNMAWSQRFSSVPDVIAKGSVEQAIDQCDSVAGVNRHCVVGVGLESDGKPFGIYRSKTKVIGLAASTPITARIGSASVYIPSGSQQIVVENLNIVGIVAGNHWTAGIELSGRRIRHVLIRDNQISNFDSDVYANAIIVYGDGINGKERISNVVIDNNHIHDMRTGFSESVAINGNVSRWAISNNRIERINNIAIDVIGGEGLVEPITINGRTMPSRFDVARQGWIENNLISDMSTADNPAYGSKPTWAAAIYVDGGRHISIEGNEVYNAPWAYDIGAENCVITRHITMINNIALNSYYGDLRLGGYTQGGYGTKNSAVNCNPLTSTDDKEGHGYVRRLTIKQNQFGSTSNTLPNVLIEYRTEQAIVIQDGVSAVNDSGKGMAPGDQNAIKTEE